MINYVKVIKIAMGSAAAIIIAYALGLDYAVSAGVIALLSLQDTKRATFFIAFIRIIAFIMATIIALIVFTLLAYTPLAYGVFLLIFVGACYYFRFNEAISINAVLVTHYLLEKDMSVAILANEALLLLIGAGIGVILNLYIPSNIKLILRKQHIIETDLKAILSQLADELLTDDKLNYDESCFMELKEHINIGIEQAYTNMNNALFQETRYYIEYMEMRKQQYKILKDISEKVLKLTLVTPQSYEVAHFMMAISSTLSTSENAKGLLKMEDKLATKFKESPLPLTREEFENRAVLYVILMDLRIFLKTKEEFADSLTQEQKDKYWKNNT